MKWVMLSSDMMKIYNYILSPNLCFLAQLLNCGGGLPHILSICRLMNQRSCVFPLLIDITGVGSSKYFPQVSISNGGSCQKYFPGHEISVFSLEKAGGQCEQ